MSVEGNIFIRGSVSTRWDIKAGKRMQIQSSDVPLTSTICAHARKVGGKPLYRADESVILTSVNFNRVSCYRLLCSRKTE